MRTRTAAVITAGLLLATLTACHSSTDDKAAATPSVKLRPSAADSNTTQYLAAAREIRFIGQPPDTELKDLATQWCEALTDGHTVQWLLGKGGLYPAGEDWGTVQDEAYKLVVAGTRAYCPTHLNTVLDEILAIGGH